MPAVSGMAAAIRAATDSETFDLAGHDAANIQQTANDAFAEPFALTDMIRITFVTGAGKLARQKYDDRAMQTLTASLRQLGYVEDRGASCVVECGGCYKTQHDTGKNLFTVVVFPRLVGQDGGDGGEGTASSSSPPSNDRYPMPLTLAEGSPGHTILLASEETFEKMAPSMCPSWSEKRFCSDVLRAYGETVELLDAKLMTGAALDEDENGFYEAVGGASSIATKVECLKKLMQHQVESGTQLTRHEIDRLVSQVTERIDALNGEIDDALRRSQEKTAAKLSAQKEKATARKKMLEGHSPQPLPKLKKEAQIAQVRKKLAPLIKLEQSTKGRLLTMKETKELAAMDDLLEEIAELEEASRGWFEDDDVFQLRVEASRKASSSASSGGARKAKPTGAGKKPGTGSRSSTAPKSTSWLTPGGLASKQNALGKKAAAKKKSKPSGNAFAAMMDSDSDSD